MGNVQITLANGQLGGTLQTNDGIAGLMVTGVSQGSYTTGTPILITKLADLAAMGVTEAGNAFAWKQVKEFYKEAGSGSMLYLMLSPATMPLRDMADGTVTGSVQKLLNYAGGKIKIVGVVSNDSAIATATATPITLSNALNDDVWLAADNIALIAETYFGQQKPFRAIIGGTSYSGVPADLRDLSFGSNNRTAVLIGDTISGNGACVGLLLGRLASIPVMRKISRVRTGSVATSTASVGTDTVEAAGAEVAVIAKNAYITWCTYPNLSGYFFSGDDTFSPATDDYHFLARGRVVDKAHILAYSTFVQEVDDEVPVNEDGTLDAGFCKWLSGQMENQINNTMTANREISSVTCEIDPAQNILATNTLNVVLSLVPVGYATNIRISLGFSNPAA